MVNRFSKWQCVRLPIFSSRFDRSKSTTSKQKREPTRTFSSASVSPTQNQLFFPEIDLKRIQIPLRGETGAPSQLTGENIHKKGDSGSLGGILNRFQSVLNLTHTATHARHPKAPLRFKICETEMLPQQAEGVPRTQESNQRKGSSGGQAGKRNEADSNRDQQTSVTTSIHISRSCPRNQFLSAIEVVSRSNTFSSKSSQKAVIQVQKPAGGTLISSRIHAFSSRVRSTAINHSSRLVRLGFQFEFQ